MMDKQFVDHNECPVCLICNLASVCAGLPDSGASKFEVILLMGVKNES
jgi:hypothetical protein